MPDCRIKGADVEKDLALIEQFLDALWLEKNLAENTLSAYRRDLTMLVEWLRTGTVAWRARKATTCRRCWANVWTAATKPAPRACSAPCVGCSSISTVRRSARTIPALLASPKLPQRLPKDLSEAQVERLLQSPAVDLPLELRDKAMLELLYATGLRVSELVG
jgi:integrase/recombinase XerD